MVSLNDLQKEARRILEEGTVKYIIGYKKPPSGFIAVPAFFSKPEDIEELIWNPTCFHNLVKFLKDEKKKKLKEKNPDQRPVAIIVKGCDSRAINVLLQEKYITRNDVYIIGVSCEKTGMINQKKVLTKSSKPISNIRFSDNNSFSIETAEGKTDIPADEIIADRCKECIANVPVIYDVLFGEKDIRNPDKPFSCLEEMESLDQDKKWAFWNKQFSKCLRCYACRSVCPLCYCDECVVDTINFAVFPDTPAEEKAQKIKWIEKSPVSSENSAYHLVRAIHLAGRCIDCGECERVCPVDIPLRFLNKKLEKEAKDLFDYIAGFDSDNPALISSFKDEDPEDFIR